MLHEGRHDVAHAHDPGIVDAAEEFDEIVGPGEEIGFVRGERLHDQFDLLLRGIFAQFPDRLLQARPELVVGGEITAVGRAGHHEGRAQLLRHVQAELQVDNRVQALRLGADHVVVRVEIVLGNVAVDGHFIAVDQLPHLFDVPGFEVRSVGVGPRAVQLDVVVAEFLCVLENVLQRVALVPGGEHSDLHGGSPFLLQIRYQNDRLNPKIRQLRRQRKDMLYALD